VNGLRRIDNFPPLMRCWLAVGVSGTDVLISSYTDILVLKTWSKLVSSSLLLSLSEPFALPVAFGIRDLIRLYMGANACYL